MRQQDITHSTVTERHGGTKPNQKQTNQTTTTKQTVATDNSKIHATFTIVKDLL